MHFSKIFPVHLGEPIDRVTSLPDVKGFDEEDASLKDRCSLNDAEMREWRRVFFSGRFPPPTRMSLGRFEIESVNVNATFHYHKHEKRIWRILVYDSNHICTGDLEGVPLGSNLEECREFLGRPAGSRRVALVESRKSRCHRRMLFL